MQTVLDTHTTRTPRALLAQALTEGMDDAAALAHLVAAGVPPSYARHQVDQLAADPMAAALRRLARRQVKADWVMTLPDRITRERGGLVVPTVDTLPVEDFYRDFYALGRPLKLTGLIDQWPALSRWSLDYFAHMAGDRLVQVQMQREADRNYELNKDTHKRTIRFADFIAWLREQDSSNDCYLTAYNTDTNTSELAPLWQDMQPPIALLREVAGPDGFLWMGPKGTLTPWHHDLTNNLLVQVVGTKRVLMAPSWAWARMRNHHHCFSDWGMFDLAPGPGDAQRPPVVETLIGPGDALFLPVGCWHAVEALTLSVSVSFTSFHGSNGHYEDYRSAGPL